MRLMCDTYKAAGVYWRISRPSAVESLLGILQECGELGLGSLIRLSMSPSIYLCSSIYNM
jgi:hypothetical protein